MTALRHRPALFNGRTLAIHVRSTATLLQQPTAAQLMVDHSTIYSRPQHYFAACCSSTYSRPQHYSACNPSTIYSQPQHYLQSTAALFTVHRSTIHSRLQHYLWYLQHCSRPTGALFTASHSSIYGRPHHYGRRGPDLTSRRSAATRQQRRFVRRKPTM